MKHALQRWWCRLISRLFWRLHYPVPEEREIYVSMIKHDFEFVGFTRVITASDLAHLPRSAQVDYKRSVIDSVIMDLAVHVCKRVEITVQNNGISYEITARLPTWKRGAS
jgi:hypothetical protein